VLEFKDLYVDGIGYIDSVTVLGGTIDDTVIGGTTPAAGTSTGTSTFTTVDIMAVLLMAQLLVLLPLLLQTLLQWMLR
jgi:hypothetical protein